MNRPKVLIVDDEEIFAQNMSRLLGRRGYDVTAVNNGQAAIQVLENRNFKVMVLDLKMPGMDGLTTLKTLKKLGLLVETLVLTGHGSLDTALEAVKLGAYDYLTKPCAIEQLVAKIETALRNKITQL
ncbi:MAG: response regulator [Syntrophobacteraceae bacterium]